MYDRTLAIYCFIDALLKAMQHTEDPRARFSDSEVVTTALVAMLYFGGNFERARSFLHSSGMMPRMLSRSRLSRRLARLRDLVEIVFHQLGLTIKELNVESRYSLDSFPVQLCDNIRISRCRLAQGEEFRGYSASKRRYFYGLRVQVVVTIEGLPVECCILPGSLADVAGLAELPLSLPAGAHIAADAAYTYYEWEDALLEDHEVRLLVARKRIKPSAKKLKNRIFPSPTPKERSSKLKPTRKRHLLRCSCFTKNRQLKRRRRLICAGI